MEAEFRLIWPGGKKEQWVRQPSVAETDANPDPDWNDRPQAVAVEELLKTVPVGTEVKITRPDGSAFAFRRMS